MILRCPSGTTWTSCGSGWVLTGSQCWCLGGRAGLLEGSHACQRAQRSRRRPSLMLHRACTLRMPTAAAHTRCAGVGGRAGGGSGGADLLCLFERPGGVPGGARGCAGEHSGSSAPLGLQRRLTCRQSTAAVALREAPFSTSLCMAPRLGAEQQPQHCCCAPRASASTCHALLCRRACASCSSPPASSSSPLSRHAGRALCCSLA